MSDELPWSILDRRVLTLVAGHNSIGEHPDANKLLADDPELEQAELMSSLLRLVEEGLLSGVPVGSWQDPLPLRFVDLLVRSSGHAYLDEPPDEPDV